MDPKQTRLIDMLVEGLADAARKGDAQNVGISILGLAVMGPPALNRTTRRLEDALREFDAPAAAALAKAILKIWETESDALPEGIIVQMNKDKARRLLSRLPRMPPKIKETLCGLRCALEGKPAQHPEGKFLRGPKALTFTVKLKSIPARLPRSMN